MTQQPNIFSSQFMERPTTLNDQSGVVSTNAFPVPAAAFSAPPSKNITVEVSGSRFCIVPSLFKHIEKLQWKKNGDALRLSANPDVFEMILQYFLFSSLPDTTALSTRKATELIDLISPLDPLTVQQLVQHVENFLATKKSSSSSSFLRRRLPSLSSMSSRNKHSLSHPKKGMRNETNNDQTPKEVANKNASTAVPSQIDAAAQDLNTVDIPPPPLQVAVQPKQLQSQDIYRSSVSSLPMSVVRSSSSSSDGSISRLSQPSYFGGSTRTHDENYNYSNTLALTENDMLEILPVVPNNENLAASQTMYPKMTEFDTPMSFPPESSTLFAEQHINAQQVPLPQQQHLQEYQGMKKEGAGSDGKKSNAKGTRTSAKENKKKSKTFFRNVFRGDRNQRKMTHEDWCNSEYVL